MSAICGLYYNRTGATVGKEILWKLAAELAERGPDSLGCFTDGNVGLAIRLLALSDQADHNQPIGNEDRTIVVTCSGEIYNGPVLRKTLEGTGHTFATTNPAEVIVHGYEEWGDEVVDRLNGMFAFALWDGRRKRLILARDCMGQRSLYWSYTSQGLVWSSMLKPILQVPWMQSHLSAVALHHYLTLHYVPDPLTIVDGVHKLPASHMLILENEQEPRVVRWWKLRFIPKVFGSPQESFAEASRTFDSVIKRHISGDGQIGVLLGGNVESSLVATYAAEHSPTPVKSFSIAFPQQYSLDSIWTRRVAKAAGTDHTEVPFAPADMAALAERAIDALSDPIGDPKLLPLCHLTEAARGKVRVLLTGEGAEETMATNPRYRADIVANMFFFFPHLVTRHLFPALTAVLPDFGWIPTERNPFMGIKRIAQALEFGPKASVLRWTSYFSHSQKMDVYRPELAQMLRHFPTSELLQRTFDSAEADRYLERSMYTDQRTYLPAFVLPRTEALTGSMMLESRAPFLDRQWVEWTAHLPLQCKQSIFRSHLLLRRGFRRKVAPALLKAKIKGFEVPTSHWLQRDLKEWAGQRLLENRALDPWLRRNAIERMWKSHLKGRKDHGARLWSLLVLSRWIEANGIRN